MRVFGITVSSPVLAGFTFGGHSNLRWSAASSLRCTHVADFFHYTHLQQVLAGRSAGSGLRLTGSASLRLMSRVAANTQVGVEIGAFANCETVGLDFALEP